MKDKLFINLWFHMVNIKPEYRKLWLNSKVTANEAWECKYIDYINIGFDMLKAENLIKSKDKMSEYIEQTKEYILKENIVYISEEDNGYPEKLKNISDPPAGLFVKGELPDITNTLAVVGARRASDYGRTAAYRLSYDAALKGITIVSGMAKGIDTASHKGAIDAGGKTIAVLGSGFKEVYPKENMKLFNVIVSSGCVITEYMPDIKPFPMNFPIRNRIISGLSSSVLVVEACEKSGSLITASLAAEQGRDIYAVPGNIYSPYSRGTNKLIRDGAKIIIDSDDVLEEYLGLKETYNLSEDNNSEQLYNYLKKGTLTAEELSDITGLDISAVLSTLCILECHGKIRGDYGNYFAL